MRYWIKGSFKTGEKFTDTARNKRELYFVLRDIFNNGACNKDVKILNGKNDDVTVKILFELTMM